MDEKYRIAYKGGEGEVIEKKSRFIATVFPVDTEDDANTFIQAMKKKYWDASHNCFAYLIGEKHQTQRCSDDGEPSGTAGRPMLEVLLGEDIHNVLVVVTRYFGGTLLGTGGLVRAYSKACKEGIENSVILDKYKGRKYIIGTDYGGLGKLQFLIGQRDLTLLDTLYTDMVELHVMVPSGQCETFELEVTEVTAGKGTIEAGNEVEYGIVKESVTIFSEKPN